VETDLRASLIASGAAALLSILVGLVSGVGALALFLRALVGGLAFGAIVLGALFLMRRFVPDLFEGQAEAVPESGGSVDIVLPGDLPEGAEVLDAEPEAGEAADIGDLAASPAAPPVQARPVRQPPGDRKARQAVDLVEEAEEVGYGAESLLEDVGPADGPVASPPPPSSRSSGGFDDLDVLPDLESLSDGFSPMADEAQGRGSQDFRETRPSRPEGGKGTDADPIALAQAVRTLLKRDQER
jgi:hypothetical protein